MAPKTAQADPKAAQEAPKTAQERLRMNFLYMHAAPLRVCVFSVSYLSVFVFCACSVCACVCMCGGIRGWVCVAAFAVRVCSECRAPTRGC